MERGLVETITGLLYLALGSHWKTLARTDHSGSKSVCVGRSEKEDNIVYSLYSFNKLGYKAKKKEREQEHGTDSKEGFYLCLDHFYVEERRNL